MSEVRPIYISCAAGENAFSDVLLERRQSLIRITGHSTVDFDVRAAEQLANHILKLVKEIQP